MKLAICIILNMFIFTANAKSSGPVTQAQVNDNCQDCRTSMAAKQNITLREIGTFIDDIGDKIGWQNRCESFVQDEMIGKYGHFIRSKVMTPGSFLNFKKGDPDLMRLCPNFKLMNESNKANVAVLLLTAMAFEESSCNNAETARGPNGTAAGFLQLHLGKEANYASACKNFDSKTSEGSLSCGLAIIDKQMAKGNLFRQEGNYWDVLRPQRYTKSRGYFANPSFTKIRNAIASFPPCTDIDKLQIRKSNKEINYEIFNAIKLNKIGNPTYKQPFTQSFGT